MMGERGIGVVASTCPASIVDASETSVVDAIDESDAAGEGVRGNVSKGGSCVSLCTTQGRLPSGRKQAGDVDRCGVGGEG